MSIRRLFWLGAAILFSVAALVAIGAVLGAGFGSTQEHIVLTCVIAFVTGGTALAGLACLDRRVIEPVGWAAVALGLASFLVYTAGIWQDSTGDSYWKAAGVLGVWTLAALVVTTLRLFASSPRLLGTVVPATWSAAVLGAAVGSEMILSEDSDPWKLVVVLVILSVLGYALTYVLQRFWAAADTPTTAERLLGRLGDVEVFAVRGEGRSVTIGSSRMRLASSEGIVLRERT
ncbi:MAG TPA: hypothetical protein VGK68_10840 [Gaiellaceae bacterium]